MGTKGALSVKHRNYHIISELRFLYTQVAFGPICKFRKIVLPLHSKKLVKKQL